MNIIYLQQLEDGEHPDDTDRTWCEDKINENDDVYIKGKVVKELIRVGWNIIACDNHRWNPKTNIECLKRILNKLKPYNQSLHLSGGNVAEIKGK